MNNRLYSRYLCAILRILFLFALPVIAYGQLSEGGIPPSFKYETTLRSNKATTAIPVDFHVEDLKRVDEWQSAEGIAPPRIAVLIDVSLSSSNAGQWIELPGGETIWQLHLHAKNAVALMLYYADFYIPEGGTLFIYNAQKTQLLGAYTHRTHPSGGPFATELIAGDELILEYVSSADNAKPRIEIEAVGYGYNHLSVEDGGVSLRSTSASCEVNVNCQEGQAWQNQKKGVCYMTQRIGSSTYLCTGSLVNNTASDLKPYIITATHCSWNNYRQATADEMLQWMFYFHKEYLGCDNTSGTVTPRSMTGCRKIAETETDGQSDGMLLILNASIPEYYGVYYNGWDRRNIPAQSGVSIHHPSGDQKKISTFNQPAVNATFNADNGVSGERNAHWNVTFVKTANGHGITENGSSGSPLFNENKLIVGTLTGGNSSCSNPTGLNLYGKLGYHWNGYTQADSTRMDRWLDPLNSGAERLDGRYHSTGSNPPVNLNVTYQDDKTVLIAWSKPLLENPVYYNVYNNNGKIAETTGLSYLDKMPKAGLQTYSVTAAYANGNESNSVSAEILVNEFKPPVNVAAAYNTQQKVEITWDAPVYEQTIYWGEHEAVYQVKLGDDRSFYFGQRWNADEIKAFNRKKLKAVKFVPIRNNTYELYIRQGEGQVYRQQITNLDYLETNTIELITPFVIDGSKELIIAVYISGISQTGRSSDYPAVCDGGPAVNGKGNLYSYDGQTWYTLYNEASDPDDFNYNFFVAGIVSSEEGDVAISGNRNLVKNNIRSIPRNSGLRKIAIENASAPVGLYSQQPKPFPTVTGYNIYRNGNKVGTITTSPNRYVDGAVTQATIYQVSAIYESLYESELSDPVSVGSVSNAWIDGEPLILSPTVFSTQVEIKGLDQIERLDVYDSGGKLCKRIHKPDNLVDVQSLAPGIYFFRIYAENGKEYVLRGIKGNR